MADTWEMAARARRSFADLVDGLDEKQLSEETLAGWNVKQVLGHLTFFTEMKLPSFFFGMLKAGFDYDKFADRIAREYAERSTDDLLSALRSGATKAAPMPGFPEMVTVGDTAIHTQDVRRPLGLQGKLDDDILTTALDFVTTHKIGMGLADIARRDEVSYVADDVDWKFGSGPEVSGPGESILMALAGRDAMGELSGDGVALIS